MSSPTMLRRKYGRRRGAEQFPAESRARMPPGSEPRGLVTNNHESAYVAWPVNQSEKPGPARRRQCAGGRRHGSEEAGAAVGGNWGFKQMPAHAAGAVRADPGGGPGATARLGVARRPRRSHPGGPLALVDPRHRLHDHGALGGPARGTRSHPHGALPGPKKRSGFVAGRIGTVVGKVQAGRPHPLFRDMFHVKHSLSLDLRDMAGQDRLVASRIGETA